MPNNYGDVALNLDPTWSRSSLISGQDFMSATVGHENGVSDLRLKERPDERHQFQWCHPADDVKATYLRTQKYELCKQPEWEKNPLLWEWTAEGFVEFRGQRGWARAASYYHAEQKAREQEADARRGRRDLDDADEFARKKLGDKAYDDEGRELRPAKRARG